MSEGKNSRFCAVWCHSCFRRLSNNIILGLDPGIHKIATCCYTWIPAFAGMTFWADCCILGQPVFAGMT
ncbi:MAG: hypothetical protein P9L92_04580 [Candidatus Electryonea clarkiae]|nr:hypothetical protein [Candidatus Electryonea clarkiae]MDP8285547.1 hypothetical protein [Candidatus Electryonea clarkiae]